MKSHGMTIDRRHVMLLADLMTFKVRVFLLKMICNKLIRKYIRATFSESHDLELQK